MHRFQLTDFPEEPVVIAHRGASGLRPEHTIEAYSLAIEQGADFIEPDLVITKDGVLVARHDPWLSDSTDVADKPGFADRRTTLKNPEGETVTDWFVWDFTYDELMTLRAKQVREGRPTEFDGQFAIPTFAEIMLLAMETPRRSDGTRLGVYPETKWPAHHKARGLDFAPLLLEELTALERRGALPPLYIQSFEPEILIELNETTDLPLIQLVYPEGWRTGGTPTVELEELAKFADGVGPYKAMVIDDQTGASTGYGHRAQDIGLSVHPWTFRDDDKPEHFTTPEEEIKAVLNAGATGFFTDFPATGRKAFDQE